MTDIYLGIDVGSTTVKIVVLDQAHTLLAHRYLRSNGQPRQTLLHGMDDLSHHFDLSRVIGVGLTGSGGEAVARLIGGHHVNELIAQTRAVGEFYPQARTVIEIGGQDSKFLSVAWDEQSGKMTLVDFAMNSLCAAGTGSFLDQQAERLGISIENEFADLALQSSTPSRIAGRCTVFAKSDMIHLQQKGTPLSDILAGLCLAMARNFKSVIGKGKAFIPPVLIQGGVAYNGGVVRAFETLLNLKPGELIVPQHHELMAAMGTAMVTMDEHAAGNLHEFHGVERLRERIGSATQARKTMPRLPARSGAPQPARGLPTGQHHETNGANGANGVNGTTGANGNGSDTATHHPAHAIDQTIDMHSYLPVYIGIDVGSISTNVVLIDEHAHVIARRYLQTSGKPLEAVRRALTEIQQQVGDWVEVCGVGTTGSGRYLTSDFAGADVVRNEISAQARAAIAIDPTVDTIFEIGGQDSKYISLHHGAVVDFAMNNACAAGTGSFLEEQSDRLDIDIKDDFSTLALSAECPTCLGERCTVFMESDIIHHQQQGAQVDELTAGLAYAIAQNYLNRVVNRRTIGKNIFFQGGVAWNTGVVAAFEQLLGRSITVPPNHDVTGAIGAAILAMEALQEQRESGEMVATRFKGFDLGDRTYQSTTFECKACVNLCEVSKVIIEGEAPVYYGARCDKFEEAGRKKQPAQGANGTSGRTLDYHTLPDLFAERTEMLLGDYTPPTERKNGRMRIGIPRSLIFYDLFPYWRTFFQMLDMEIVVSDSTNPNLASIAIEHASAETCYPVKLVYGHVLNLLEKGADIIFLPSIINRENSSSGQPENNYCPYIPASPYLVAAQIDMQARGARPLHAPLHMEWPKIQKQELKDLAKQLGVPPRRAIEADKVAMQAQKAFYQAIRERGRAVLASLAADQLAAVIVGRPYNTSDRSVCLDLPFKIRKLGFLPIPMDFLPLDEVDFSNAYNNMYWRSGQDILAAATIVRNDPRLQAIYVSSFNCGPDSFITSFFSRIMGDKPYLELEIDEHTADAGIITRCEAFFDSLTMGKGALV